MMRTDFDFLVVGAGPVGLAVAALLGRAGGSVLVLEEREAPTSPNESRAITWMPEGLLLAEHLGLLERLCDKGVRRTQHLFLNAVGGNVLVRNDFSRLPHRHPYTLNLPQHDTETALIDAAAETGNVQVLRGHRVVAAVDSRDDVEVTSIRGEGSHRWRARYGVACDGASSPRDGVGSLLGISNSYRDYGSHSAVADVRLQQPSALRSDQSWVALDPRRPVGAFCFGEGLWRVTYRINANERPEDALSEVYARSVAETVLKGAPIKSLVWASAFRLRQAQAESYGVGRWTLVGDAAHAMGPSAGAGMMVGLLGAWRYALVGAHVLTARGSKDRRIELYRDYETKQRAVSRRVQRSNALIFKNLAVTSAAVGAVRNAALGAAGWVPSLGRRMTQEEALSGLSPRRGYGA